MTVKILVAWLEGSTLLGPQRPRRSTLDGKRSNSTLTTSPFPQVTQHYNQRVYSFSRAEKEPNVDIIPPDLQDISREVHLGLASWGLLAEPLGIRDGEEGWGL